MEERLHLTECLLQTEVKSQLHLKYLQQFYFSAIYFTIKTNHNEMLLILLEYLQRDGETNGCASIKESDIPK